MECKEKRQRIETLWSWSVETNLATNYLVEGEDIIATDKFIRKAADKKFPARFKLGTDCRGERGPGHKGNPLLDFSKEKGVQMIKPIGRKLEAGKSVAAARATVEGEGAQAAVSIRKREHKSTAEAGKMKHNGKGR